MVEGVKYLFENYPLSVSSTWQFDFRRLKGRKLCNRVIYRVSRNWWYNQVRGDSTRKKKKEFHVKNILQLKKISPSYPFPGCRDDSWILCRQLSKLHFRLKINSSRHWSPIRGLAIPPPVSNDFPPRFVTDTPYKGSSKYWLDPCTENQFILLRRPSRFVRRAFIFFSPPRCVHLLVYISRPASSKRASVFVRGNRNGFINRYSTPWAKIHSRTRRVRIKRSFLNRSTRARVFVHRVHVWNFQEIAEWKR